PCGLACKDHHIILFLAESLALLHPQVRAVFRKIFRINMGEGQPSDLLPIEGIGAAHFLARRHVTEAVSTQSQDGFFDNLPTALLRGLSAQGSCGSKTDEAPS